MLKPVLVGRRPRFRRDDLERYLAALRGSAPSANLDVEIQSETAKPTEREFDLEAFNAALRSEE